MKVTVSSGDTLLQLTRQAMREQGMGSLPRMPFSELMNRMTTVAQTNAIKNPDLIFPGQVIDFTPILGRPLAGNDASKETSASPLGSTASADLLGYRADLAKVSAVSGPLSAPSNYRVLERTLDRAVSKGYLPQGDVAEVGGRILDMARQHRFVPDDFARVALIESDGLNPRATNGNCDGIIQFCDGPDGGAASVGYGREPKAILEKSVVEQFLTKQKISPTVVMDVQGKGGTEYGAESIRDKALKTGADLPFACKGGVCATCKAKLLEGEVEMEVNYALEEDELEAGYILTCQSHPRTEKLIVDYDH